MTSCWACCREPQPDAGVGMGMCHEHFMEWLAAKLKERGAPAVDVIPAPHGIPAK